MAENESGQEKTEEATPKRLQKAREEGQVPRSRELNTSFVLLAGVGSLMIFGPQLAESMHALMRFNFSFPRAVAFDETLMLRYLLRSAYHVLEALLPVFAFLLVAALLGPIALGGWLVSGKAIMPKFSRMNPLKGLQRMFSANSLVELAKALAKFVLVTGVAILILVFFQASLVQLPQAALETALGDAMTIISWSVLALSSSLILVALIDVPWQIFDHSKKMKMTLQEVKDEMKDTEGKPEVKSRVRQLQRQLAQRRMMEAVPEADVVITNPEHFSVALKYDPNGSGAPVVVAKGSDHLALKIREVAKANEVPQMAVPALARSIYFTTELEQEIPAVLFLAVAQVLAYVFQLKAYQRGEGRRPKPLATVDVPSEAQFDSDGRHRPETAE